MPFDNIQKNDIGPGDIIKWVVDPYLNDPKALEDKRAKIWLCVASDYGKGLLFYVINTDPNPYAEDLSIQISSSDYLENDQSFLTNMTTSYIDCADSRNVSVLEIKPRYKNRELKTVKIRKHDAQKIINLIKDKSREFKKEEADAIIKKMTEVMESLD